MTDKDMKRGILGLLAISYFGLFTLLCTIIRPKDLPCLLLMLAFAFIWAGIEFYFCISTAIKKAVFTSREFMGYGYVVPLVLYLVASAVDYLSLRKWFIRTSVAVAMAILYRSAILLKDAMNKSSDDDGEE